MFSGSRGHTGQPSDDRDPHSSSQSQALSEGDAPYYTQTSFIGSVSPREGYQSSRQVSGAIVPYEGRFFPSSYAEEGVTNSYRSFIGSADSSGTNVNPYGVASTSAAPSGPRSGAATFSGRSTRARVTMACTHCRSRKIRCDGRQPSCSTCTRLSRTCQYENISESENAIIREKKKRSRETKQARLEGLANIGVQHPRRSNLPGPIVLPEQGRVMGSGPMTVPTYAPYITSSFIPNFTNIPHQGIPSGFTSQVYPSGHSSQGTSSLWTGQTPLQSRPDTHVALSRAMGPDMTRADSSWMASSSGNRPTMQERDQSYFALAQMQGGRRRGITISEYESRFLQNSVGWTSTIPTREQNQSVAFDREAGAILGTDPRSIQQQSPSFQASSGMALSQPTTPEGTYYQHAQTLSRDLAMSTTSSSSSLNIEYEMGLPPSSSHPNINYLSPSSQNTSFGNLSRSQSHTAPMSQSHSHSHTSGGESQPWSTEASISSHATPASSGDGLSTHVAPSDITVRHPITDLPSSSGYAPSRVVTPAFIRTRPDLYSTPMSFVRSENSSIARPVDLADAAGRNARLTFSETTAGPPGTMTHQESLDGPYSDVTPLQTYWSKARNVTALADESFPRRPSNTEAFVTQFFSRVMEADSRQRASVSTVQFGQSNLLANSSKTHYSPRDIASYGATLDMRSRQEHPVAILERAPEESSAINVVSRSDVSTHSIGSVSPHLAGSSAVTPATEAGLSSTRSSFAHQTSPKMGTGKEEAVVSAGDFDERWRAWQQSQYGQSRSQLAMMDTAAARQPTSPHIQVAASSQWPRVGMPAQSTDEYDSSQVLADLSQSQTKFDFEDTLETTSPQLQAGFGQGEKNVSHHSRMPSSECAHVSALLSSATITGEEQSTEFETQGWDIPAATSVAPLRPPGERGGSISPFTVAPSHLAFPAEQSRLDNEYDVTNYESHYNIIFDDD